MHEKHYIKYVCSYCGKEFDVKFWCEQHEKEQHKCYFCKHHYLVHCKELNCKLKDEGNKCNFEPKENQ